MDLGFSGEVVDLYHEYRRGYPLRVITEIVEAFDLRSDDVSLDLGCGTGQVALPLAPKVRAVIGMDPEPDMLARAHQAAEAHGVANACWVLGKDTDVPVLRAVLGDRRLGAVTIGQALHWMDHEQLFPDLAPLIRPGGGIAILTNGLPLWLQDTGWSRALREWLQNWIGTELHNQCGTDQESQERYDESLRRHGFEVTTTAVDYSDELELEQIVGGVYSALPVNLLPAPGERSRLAEGIAKVLEPHRPFVEHVPVTILLGLS